MSRRSAVLSAAALVALLPAGLADELPPVPKGGNRRQLAQQTLDALEKGIAEGTKLALAGGTAGDEGEPDRKRVALLLYKASKAINADAERADPLMGLGKTRGRARRLAGEAERLARLLARTFTEWKGGGPIAGALLSRGEDDS